MITKNSYFFNNIIIFIVFNFANFGQFLFQVIIIRSLNFSDYAIFSSLNAIMGILLIPSTAIIFGISSLLNEDNEIDLNKYFKLINSIFPIIFVIILLVFLSKNFILNYLNIENANKAFLLMLSSSFFTYLLTLILAFFNTYRKHFLFSLFSTIPFYVKFIIALLFILIFGNLETEDIFFSITASSLIGILACLLYIFFFQKINIFNKYQFNFSYSLTLFKKIFFNIINALVINFFIFYDSLVIKHILEAELAGKYLVALTILKISFFIIAMLPSIIYPELSNINVKNYNKFWLTFFLSLFLQLVALLSLFFISPFVLPIIFNFHDINLFQNFMSKYFLVIIFLNLILLINSLLISRQKFYVIFFQVFIIIISFGIIEFSVTNISSFIYAFNIISALVLSISFFGLYKIIKR